MDTLKKGNEMKKVILLSLTIFGMLAFSAQKAQAELITIAITATVDAMHDDGNYLEGKVHVGDSITGTYTYESTTPDTNPATDVGDYWHYSSPAGISLAVGGFNFKTDPANVKFLVEIVNNNGGIDAFLVRSDNNLFLSNGTYVDCISWDLQDRTLTALSSDSLPTTAPVLSQWQTNFLTFGGGAGKSNSFAIAAHVTSAIPEPATISLLLLGGFLLRKRTNKL